MATQPTLQQTQVAIIGSGPSGLLLGHQLRMAGIGAVILERRSMDYVLGRIRAGVLEPVTTDLLHRIGISERLDREGIGHNGFMLADGNRLIRIDMQALVGDHVTVYGQTEVTRDLIDAASERGLEIVWEAEDVALHDTERGAPFVTYQKNGENFRIDCTFIAGCDGSHGPSRQTVPQSLSCQYERVYPFGWLGILADVPPCNEELIYANHPKGFALASMRSHKRSRYYIQVPLNEQLNDWPDDRIWDELELRLGHEAGANILRGPSIEKSIAPLRSYIFETMRHGRLFLAGDAAHIVPPTGAKGLNLAASDVIYLAEALIDYFRKDDEEGLAAYPAKALARIWQASRFSWYLTNLMHRFPEVGEFNRKMQLAELDYIANSETARRSIAENYIGLPL
jgi:p-hydroxybenzoate 3-monooxygenase